MNIGFRSEAIPTLLQPLESEKMVQRAVHWEWFHWVVSGSPRSPDAKTGPQCLSEISFCRIGQQGGGDPLVLLLVVTHTHSSGRSPIHLNTCHRERSSVLLTDSQSGGQHMSVLLWLKMPLMSSVADYTHQSVFELGIISDCHKCHQITARL